MSCQIKLYLKWHITLPEQVVYQCCHDNKSKDCLNPEKSWTLHQWRTSHEGCVDFYRAMHFSAKRGIAITCRLSVRLSVCPSVRLSVTLVNCDNIGWKSSEIISPSVSLGCSLFATSTWRVCSKGNTPKFGPKVTHPAVDLSVGDIRS